MNGLVLKACGTLDRHEIDHPGKNCTHGDAWAFANETAMLHHLRDVEPLLRSHSAFAGFAVFGSWWYGNALAQPAPANITWPAETGVWYINNSMVLDPDASTRDDWLRWAASRNISQVYVNPESPIPGNDMTTKLITANGSSQSDRKFCDFIHVAAKQGLAVQLFSSPLADLPFLRSCNASAMFVS